ncbi:MAG: hypothetical protein A2Y09_09615 [Planctomycetes bacterium GWA2_39_15]|nr:MAG: hypothetical protein A2Y09_09615 [Planctomycetes bacterium GWA2_39_15]
MKIRSYQLTIKTDRPLNTHSVSLRGFIGRQFPHLELLHNHTSDNSLIYTYPRVLYHVMNGYAIIIGIEEGVDAVKLVVSNLTKLLLNNTEYKIVEKIDTESEIDFGIIKNQLIYSFLAPWLALNERNFEQYQQLEGWTKKKDFLEKILIGNIISMSKGLGYTVSEPIKANIINLREVSTSLKGTPMLGFLGSFSVNFEIPDYWGVGKSVSRGFGTIKRVEELGS